MALKGDYQDNSPPDISFFMNEVSNRGSIVSYSTQGSGAALDQSAALVTVAAVASGKKPVGMLLCDMVNLDLTRQHLNQHKYEVQKGGKVEILMDGWRVTDQIASGITIAAGDAAYLANGGRVTNVQTSALVNPAVGRFLSNVDEDGYAKVQVQL
jgi:hypothetical protein